MHVDGTGAGETFWGIVRDAAGAAVLALGGIVAWLWRKVMAVDALNQRLDVLATSVQDVIERQERIETQQRRDDILLAEIKETLAWLREAISEIKRKLDK